MPAEFDRCVQSVIEQGKSEQEAYAICAAQFNDSGEKITRQFSDLAIYSSTDKTAVSIRDGVLEYLGSELGLEPADKIFTVYRSPATIANAAHKMVGIPLTDLHVSLDASPPNTGSVVESAEVIDQVDEHTSSRLAVKNKIKVSDMMAGALSDKRQLSLGYYGDLVPHSRWDYEQVGIVPHHLAAVPAGRCGPLCSFIDRKPTTKPKPQEGDSMKLPGAFLDAEGAVSLEQIVEIATALPEAIKKVPVDKLQELMPAMQEVISYAKSQGVVAEPGEEDAGEQMADEDMESDDDKEKAFADAVSAEADKRARSFADAEVQRFAEVISKARDFLDADYSFVGKSADQVMRDALATQHTEKFTDAELSVAFKLLRKSEIDYSKFGDSKPGKGGLESRIKQELGE